jgi:Fe-S cluster biogenesis protein NfuA
MPDAIEDKELRDRFHRIDNLLKGVEKFRDPQAQAQTREIVQCLMDLHGAVLERMLDHVSTSPRIGTDLIDSLARDDVIASLLLLYGLHPLDLETRVREALEKCRPYLHSHGGNVELLGVEDGVVRLKLEGSCHGCPSSSQTLKSTIEEAIAEKAPDAASVIVEGEIDHPAAENSGTGNSNSGRFALPVLAG